MWPQEKMVGLVKKFKRVLSHSYKHGHLKKWLMNIEISFSNDAAKTFSNAHAKLFSQSFSPTQPFCVCITSILVHNTAGISTYET